MTAQQLREKYTTFFASKGHQIIDGASLIPENDPSVLFTTAGMHPLVPFLLGSKHPSGNKLTSCQRCIRTGDIEEVGDDTHLTFFEMLGNWSLGDYFKDDAIEYSWEFLTSPKWLNINPQKIGITVFAGDQDASVDEESVNKWLSLGVPQHKIAYLPKENNWWGPAGQTGPCGPDTEMFYYVGDGLPSENSNPGNDESNWVEIWNDVFMQYSKEADGSYFALAQKNVDTGMGLERTLAVINGYQTIYETDVVKPIYDLVYSLAQDKSNLKAIRIITDHLRAATFIIGDERGVIPSNTDQGYVVRRLIRSAIRRGREVGIVNSFIPAIAAETIKLYAPTYNCLKQNQQKILSEFSIEEEKFKKVLDRGEEIIQEYARQGSIDGVTAFKLYSTYGFPLEEIQRSNIQVDAEQFFAELKKHQELSRQGAEQKFKGGLADNSEMVTKLHTATHLLHAALRKVLGEHIAQKGSNITSERLRFDFSHPIKLTTDELTKVEKLVNEAIQQKLAVSWQELSVEKAKEQGALGLFNQKYGELVKVYTVGKDDRIFSREICGGPHVANTGELGHFSILKEEASSAGVRRIKSILK
ncbi:MAG: alanine--tRNA ligase [Candidatus Komeilibacteria bacterium CG_4_10_14_0_2_um_filter_37_10]|uniref:Alanine--tRNA ligase n=1 Tax=Candidatus Komeilibacteria bacterium CG_4_10_14_0_2_um_filter_37_10 TaxID=1974470 RepID=A0A2M7VDX2_9BACT|nr:MAG: alanine--tRNA ligase [Candidatus Komeilibacteria bacterium CG_4_10_14_0_2_um_filter_37_10]